MAFDLSDQGGAGDGVLFVRAAGLCVCVCVFCEGFGFFFLNCLWNFELVREGG